MHLSSNMNCLFCSILSFASGYDELLALNNQLPYAQHKVVGRGRLTNAESESESKSKKQYSQLFHIYISSNLVPSISSNSHPCSIPINLSTGFTNYL
jgi:hypothetical protein